MKESQKDSKEKEGVAILEILRKKKTDSMNFRVNLLAS